METYYNLKELLSLRIPSFGILNLLEVSDHVAELVLLMNFVDIVEDEKTTDLDFAAVVGSAAVLEHLKFGNNFFCADYNLVGDDIMRVEDTEMNGLLLSVDEKIGLDYLARVGEG